MAERWQQWMPFHIDKFRGSPDVQAMHPAARWGYLSLLASMWQSEDCTITDDPLDLATESGLGDDLWAMYSPRIMRKFETIDGGRLRNSVLYIEWQEAKRKFEEGKYQREEVSAKRAASATLGGRAKWGTEPSSTSKTSSQIRSERLRAARAIATHTDTEWSLLVDFFGHCCVRCNALGEVVKDHIVPIYQGGSDGIDNLQPLCSKCNSSKGPEAVDFRRENWRDAFQVPSELLLTPSLTGTGTGTGTKKNPSRAEKPRNNFYEPVKDLVFRYYRAKNGIEPEWNGREGKSLAMLLAANPNAPIEHWTRCLTNRFHSEVAHGERPGAWIGKLSSFTVPLNQFGKPLNGGKENGRVEHNQDAFRAAARELLDEDEHGNNIGYNGQISGNYFSASGASESRIPQAYVAKTIEGEPRICDEGINGAGRT